MRSRLFLVATLLAGAATPVVGASVACAGSGDRAALVVDTGEASFTYCVALSDDSVSGLELIELANDQHGLRYRFGEGGQAVCMLADVGTEGDDCFGEYPDFWGFWQGDDEGGWTWSSVGAGSTLVRNGDVHGWSWGSGQDGSTHPQPPPTEFQDVCEPAPAPPSKERDQRRPLPSAPQSAPAPEERKPGDRTEEPPQESDVSRRRLTPRTATAFSRTAEAGDDATPTPEIRQDTALATEETSSPSLVPTLIAVAVIAVLGAGGLMARKRRRT